MAKNDLILLDGILDEYVSKGIPSVKTDEVFEYFATEQILKDYAFSKEQILSGSVDGRNDGGIDEFFVLVNGHLAESIPEDFWPKSNAELEVYILTCKHDSSFKQAPITTMIPSLMELFDFSKNSTDMEDSYNQALLKKRELLKTTYRRIASALVKFNIQIIYACRGDESIEDNIQSKADQTEKICQDFFSECTAKFQFWGNSKLLKKYRERPRSTLDLKFEQCINQDGQYVVLANILSYGEFITASNGQLNKHLFDSNVRDYLGLNPVNIDIQKTLKNDEGYNFWWLNNGITVIGTKAHIVGNSISIENVQIVNGLQTSESIYNYITECKPERELRSVLIKILISNDLGTSNAIIYATNNQTNVNVSALHATDKIQCDIEDALKLHGIYYDRRTNLYQNQGIPESLIINPLTLAAGYISLIYKHPQIATSLKQKFMRDNRKYEQVFSSNTNLNVWYPIATLLLKTDKYMTELKPEIVGHGQINNFLKNYRQIVLFGTVARILGTFAFGEKQLIEMDCDLFTKEAVWQSLTDLMEMKEKCFANSKKLKRSFYIAYFEYITDKYEIQAVQAIAKKSGELWSGRNALGEFNISDELVEKIEKSLPPQPWTTNIHNRVAKKLGVTDVMVSNTIQYLVYQGRINAQVYGYVFDPEDNIIAEGDHFGRSEKEAREKLKLQRKRMESRFGF